MKVDKKALEFDWDEGNIGKNKKHNVLDNESEESFFDQDKVIFKDKLHSEVEERPFLIGKTRKSRLLYVIVTYRNSKIRIISARDINKQEFALYD